jgi:predicted DNA-binding protein YlxM (UPF0122 family)
MNKIPITLTKGEWSSLNTWITSASRIKFERVSEEWFTELLAIVKPFYMSLYFSDDYSAMKIPHDSEHTLELERKYLKFLVYSVGRIAYDFDVKTPTAQEALTIVNKLEEQGDEKWKKNRY